MIVGFVSLSPRICVPKRLVFLLFLGGLYDDDEMTTDHVYEELSFSVPLVLEFAIIAAPV